MTYHQAFIKGSMSYEIVLREGIFRVLPGLAVHLIFAVNLNRLFIVNFLLLLFINHNAQPILLNIESQIFHFLIH